MSWVVKKLNFGPNFQHNSKFMDFAKFHPSQVRPCQKSLFWARFSSLLKISLFHQILSFSGPEWSKFSILSQIFNATQNFYILPNFIVRGSRVVKNVNFEPNFQGNSKFLDLAKFHLSQVPSGLSIWAKFSLRMKIFKFCKISSFPCSEWSKMSVLIQIFNTAENVRILQNFILRWSFLKMSIWVKFSTQLQISGCCQISSFAGPEWSKVSILSQMFSATENFWIVPNFILCMLWVVKNVSFELVFDTNQNFLILQNFILSRSGVVKFSISSQIFNATEYFWILPNFILCRPAVVKNCIFEPNFQHKSKFFLILQNFILSRSGVVKTSISSQIFNATENFWILPNFILHRSGVVKNLIFEPNFQHKSKFS